MCAAHRNSASIIICVHVCDCSGDDDDRVARTCRIVLQVSLVRANESFDDGPRPSWSDLPVHRQALLDKGTVDTWESFKPIWSFRGLVHGTMNLDSLSFTLSQISYLVASIARKNHRQVEAELQKVSSNPAQPHPVVDKRSPPYCFISDNAKSQRCQCCCCCSAAGRKLLSRQQTNAVGRNDSPVCAVRE